jgi:hypothetical protein
MLYLLAPVGRLLMVAALGAGAVSVDARSGLPARRLTAAGA